MAMVGFNTRVCAAQSAVTGLCTCVGLVSNVSPHQEFRTFVEATEKELLALFNSIDRDHNGRLDKDELRAAFAKAGLVVSNSKLDQFFSEVDTNHDGEISFEEWRYVAISLKQQQ
jgi:Ca2+-binding EF-hand superfamily protein